MEAVRNNKDLLSEPGRPIIDEIEDDIYYVNLDKAEMDHLKGIHPTVPVRRTIQGVIEGRDEFLEKALEIIRNGYSNKHLTLAKPDQRLKFSLLALAHSQAYLRELLVKVEVRFGGLAKQGAVYQRQHFQEEQ